MVNSSLKEMTRNRQLKTGGFVMEFFSPSIGQLLKDSGCDFTVLDMEHSAVGFETIKSAIRYCRAAELPTVVRVPTKGSSNIARALDAGAEGLLVPMVSSAEQAKQIIESAKYVPVGQRGVALIPANDRWPKLSFKEKLDAANYQTTLFTLIETTEGVRNAEAIASLPEIDCLWIGHMDLSCSLGIPGEYEHADFKNAVAAVRSACLRHNKSLGRLAGTIAEAFVLFKEGYDIISYSSDVWLLQAAMSEGISSLRKQCAEDTGR